MSEWINVNDLMPPRDVDLLTKIDDEKGQRNEAVLRFHSNLWWLPDMSMYVYYSPTHWKPK